MKFKVFQENRHNLQVNSIMKIDFSLIRISKKYLKYFKQEYTKITSDWEGHPDY